ncbi:putative transport protein bos1 protein [Zalerion maritima]|uniref:Protein transport protein BOS1 n=1 Tax=Zalerion maritima TaxID=339359 RepID=A0AAD5RRK9_9PEZI|nr:putative transport protein bos1 protein [Zalerion maritima]
MTVKSPNVQTPSSWYDLSHFSAPFHAKTPYNTAFNSALKQSTAIRKDLSALSSSGNNPDALTPATIGALSSSLTSFSRTLDEYNNLAKQEFNTVKQDKAQERIRTFRTELRDYRDQFSTLKSAKEEAVQAGNRSELLGRRPYVSATPENPYANAAAPTQTNRYASSAAPNSSSGPTFGSADEQREGHALREQNFFSNTNNTLDEYIMRGQAVLGNLGEQRSMLKSTQRKLYSTANTLGISGDTIRMVERRAKEDKWVFWGGVIVFVLFCWACIHYLR